MVFGSERKLVFCVVLLEFVRASFDIDSYCEVIINAIRSNLIRLDIDIYIYLTPRCGCAKAGTNQKCFKLIEGIHGWCSTVIKV